MRRWQKITLGIIISALLVFFIGGYIFYRLLNNSLPVYEGSLQATGLKEKVEIYRDSMAVPYIFASNDEDAAFALGYLHAQERMFMMDLVRRAGAGRLSEVMGQETVPFDKMFRTIGIDRTVKKIKNKMNPSALQLLEAYSNGVNLYITHARNKYTFEFDMLGYLPEEWKPEHSLTIIRMMAWELNLSWWTDMAFTELVQKIGKEKIEEVLPDYPQNAPTIIPEHLKKFATINRSFLETDKSFRKFMGMRGTHIGSNNWVVNGDMSSSGKPIIANDPHLAFMAPGTWYAAVVKSPEWEAAGVTLPGAPGIAIGNNKDISWVLTNIMNDDSDFYFEEIDSSEKKYLLDDQWRDLIIIEDTIFVNGGDPVAIEIRETHRGPIISDIHPYTFAFNNDYTGYPPISMRWIGNEISDELHAFLKINKAANWKEFKAAVQMFNAPGQNFVYGDVEGNIGYVFGGALPLRGDGTINSTTFVFDGTTSKSDWTGLLNRDRVPLLFNPEQNFIASANNKTVIDFKYHITNLWEPSSRIDRITELIKSKDKHSPEDFMQYQMDMISPYSKKIIPYFLNAFDTVKITYDNLLISIQLLRDWDYELDKFAQAPAIYLTSFKFLLQNTFVDEMGDDLFNQYVFLANVPYRSIQQLLENPSSVWWDNINTSEVETRDDIIRESVGNALAFLENHIGEEIGDWQWGALHKVVFKHPFSGNYSLLDKFINIGPYEIGGDGTTIFNTEYPFSESIEQYPMFRHDLFENDLGPSMRYIYDFANPDEFFLILTTGQSGNVMSEHYRDMSLLWLSGKYMKISTNVDSIKSPKNKLLKLLP
jgi:penicillin amidase